MNVAAIFFMVGMALFAGGMIQWSHFNRDWRDAAGLGAAAGGLVLLVSSAVIA